MGLNMWAFKGYDKRVLFFSTKESSKEVIVFIKCSTQLLKNREREEERALEKERKWIFMLGIECIIDGKKCCFKWTVILSVNDSTPRELKCLIFFHFQVYVSREKTPLSIWEFSTEVTMSLEVAASACSPTCLGGRGGRSLKPVWAA